MNKTINETRLDNLRSLIDECGTAAAFSEKIDKATSQISQWVTGKRNLGDKVCREIEEIFNLPVGWMDSSRLTNIVAPKANFEVGQIPVVGSAKLGDQEAYFVELDYPVGSGDGFIDWPTRDPNAYALRCVGDSMMPRIKHGEFVIIEPNHDYVNGDEVVVKDLRGRVMVKVFARKDTDRAYFESVNNAYAPFPIDLKDIEKMHYVAGIAKSALHRT